ncbi:DUF3575 domain-containing protein [Parabacteroides faecis]|uniref:DUF3575 domain-containing protein n=1 Tax=Parabacteroides TaxID=375288 RepID=UPI000EFED51D|nr:MULTISPECIES: DUF3575 domain-containing protein [Parabacteroides]MBC8619801.1 DUF3575 domain-containing protein [Parabacteroides faecis]RHR37954.1 DUF3575 domain-containing protein [Parabacteroides sp. AF18-52]RHS00609.1 DUF3575 domain-containing protein [Parabacteroides sp. AF14-59]
MKKILFIALLLCCLGWEGKAQTVAVKSNILYDATATVNLGVEVGFNQHWSLDISGNYNGWDIVSDKSWKHWMVQPEARYWLHEKFNGHYFGLHGIYIDYDIANSNFMSVMKKKFAYDGNGYGGGLSYGYQLYLSPHWNIEFSAGVGFVHFEYDKSAYPADGESAYKYRNNYFGPTKLGVSIVYIIK